jgi:hypothetical protein
MQTTTSTDIRDEKTTLGELGSGAFLVLAVIGLVAMAVGVGIGLAQGDQLARFLHSYLVSFCYVLSISLGAFFLVAVHHATRAGWGIVLRRICEILAANMTLLLLLSLPILLSVLAGNQVLYEWTNPEVVRSGSEHYNELLAHKRPYLNVPFFGIRAIGYFVIWWLLSRYYLGRSVQQDDSGDPALTVRMERWSGPSLILFGVTVTFASFDWLMSLEAQWFSTIFGLYFFSGSVIASLAAVILVTIALQATGRVTTSITVEHYHDLGKLLFAFVVFWGYMAFSQYMLIWYANIPEETVWYLERQTGGWAYVSLALLFGHLLIPFFGLMSREVKRRKPLLAFWAIWLLVFHWIDLYWIVMPSLGLESPPFGLMDICIWLGMECLYVAGLLKVAGEKSLVPQKDPRLAESLAFENY